MALRPHWVLTKPTNENGICDQADEQGDNPKFRYIWNSFRVKEVSKLIPSHMKQDFLFPNGNSKQITLINRRPLHTIQCWTCHIPATPRLSPSSRTAHLEWIVLAWASHALAFGTLETVRLSPVFFFDNFVTWWHDVIFLCISGLAASDARIDRWTSVIGTATPSFPTSFPPRSIFLAKPRRRPLGLIGWRCPAALAFDPALTSSCNQKE